MNGESELHVKILRQCNLDGESEFQLKNLDLNGESKLQLKNLEAMLFER